MPTKKSVWVAAERQRAINYLHTEKVEHLGVGDYPAFHVWPYLALWAVQSKSCPGWVGWWVITGDIPTDYIGRDEAQHPRKALKVFASHWTELAAFMIRGEAHPTVRIGTPDQWPKLGGLLQARASILLKYADDDEIWRDDSP